MFVYLFQPYYCNFFLLFLPASISYRLLCGQGLILACMQSVFNKLKLELETSTCSTNLQWMFYFKNHCASVSLSCSRPTRCLDHWYRSVPNRFPGSGISLIWPSGLGSIKQNRGEIRDWKYVRKVGWNQIRNECFISRTNALLLAWVAADPPVV